MITFGTVYHRFNMTRRIQTASAAKGATAATAANRIRRTREAIDVTSERVVKKKVLAFLSTKGPPKSGLPRGNVCKYRDPLGAQ